LSDYSKHIFAPRLGYIMTDKAQRH